MLRIVARLEGYCARRRAKIAPGENHVGRLDRDIRAGADGEADIGLGSRRST